jgi:hypothetical protein
MLKRFFKGGKNRSKQILKVLLHIAILAGVLLAANRYLRGEEVLHALSAFNYAYLPGMLFLATVFIILKSWRFVLWMRLVTDIPSGIIMQLRYQQRRYQNSVLFLIGFLRVYLPGVIQEYRPGFQGVPSNGSSQRSNPHQPAVFQARISRIERVKSKGFVLAVPAIIKFQFRKAPAKATMPTKAPRIKAIPTKVSLMAISGANQV